jgi:hypothetical protein
VGPGRFVTGVATNIAHIYPVVHHRIPHSHEYIYSWTHVKCFGLPRKLKQEGATIESFVTDDLNDPEGLLGDHADEIIAEIESKGAAAKTAHKKDPDQASSTNTMLGIIKRNYKMENVDDEEDRPSKKTKLLSDAEKEEVELYALYKQKTLDELKDYMRYVGYVVSTVGFFTLSLLLVSLFVFLHNILCMKQLESSNRWWEEGCPHPTLH